MIKCAVLLVVFSVALEACGPSGAAPPPAGSPPPGPAPPPGGAPAPPKEKRSIRFPEPYDRLSAVIFTSLPYSPKTADVQAQEIAKHLLSLSSSSHQNFENVQKKAENVDGRLAVEYRLEGEGYCHKVLDIAAKGIRLSPLIRAVDVDCAGGFKAYIAKN
ncbi:hypothetical protein QR680_012343 [Steinernema hermaphroditum]|uniref:Cystatin domain-containing protein n=1 Tax=Steinernema hermaphroditum TaxID=289476 RepID=A0AA39I3Q3_9BILA|nr:hypothetical protein QR680_012343 [Steinernema hermaphroditum]